MNKLIAFTLILVSMIVAFTLIFDGPKGTPEPWISVKVGDQEVKPIFYGDRYNKSREDIERYLVKPFEESGWESLPYVKLGDEVVIQFENFEAKNVTVTEDLLKQDGTFLYGDKSTVVHEVKVEKDGVSFELPSNWAVHLSSNSESYKPGHVIRAFVIRTEINKSDFAFAFVIRTNP
jgi:hypothetical protein